MGLGRRPEVARTGSQKKGRSRATVNAEEVVALVQTKVKEAGGICALSRQTGVHTAIISLTVRGKMKPPPCLTTALGLKRVVTYEPI